MKRIIRYFVIGVVAAIAFLVAIVAIFLSVFDANEYKDELSVLVLEHTGRDLQFHGDVSLTVFPALGMQLGAMSLSNAEGFGPQPMVKVKQASISVDLGSLIAFQPEVDQLVLHNLEIDLQRNAAGVTNWDDLVPSESSSPSSMGESDSADVSSSSSPPTLRGAFGGLDLQNIQLSWIDRQANTEFQIKDLDLSTGRIVPDESFPLQLHVDASASSGHHVVIDLNTMVEYLIKQQQLTLSDMNLALNEFQIGGMIQVRNFAKPALRFDLNSPELDVDALLAEQPKSEATTVDESTNDQAAVEDTRIELPMQTLRDLDIDGQLGIARLKIQNLRYNDVHATLKANGGIVSVKPLKMKAYEGTVESNVAIDVRGDIPKYGVSKSIDNVQVGDLLRDYNGQDFISGSLSAETNMTTNGEWISELKKRSNGTMQLAFLDGALSGFNLRHAIDTAKAKVRGKEPPSDEPLKTDFSSLTVSGVVRNGVFFSDDLDLQAPLLRVGGKGKTNLNNETIDYLVNAKLVGTLEGQAGGSSDELDGLEIPVGIKGPFNSAKIDVLLDEMLKSKVDAEREKLKAEIEKQKQELEKQLEVEKKALAESKKREAEKKKEVEKAKLKQKQKKAEKKAKEKLRNELENLFD